MQKNKTKIINYLTLFAVSIISLPKITFGASGDEAKSNILPFIKTEASSWAWVITLFGALLTIAGMIQNSTGRGGNRKILYMGVLLLFIGASLVGIIFNFVK